MKYFRNTVPCSWPLPGETGHRHKAQKRCVLSLSVLVDFYREKTVINAASLQSYSQIYLSNDCRDLRMYSSSPFGVEQVSDLLVVNLHEGDLHSEALPLLGLLHSPAEQGAAEPRDQTGLLRRAHHGVRLPRACRHTHTQTNSYSLQIQI